MTKPSRREEILQALATMLESQPGARITTAALAKEVGVSEAALYRHFPSKAKMLEGLIEFIEESLFSRISRIMTGLSVAGASGSIRSKTRCALMPQCRSFSAWNAAKSAVSSSARDAVTRGRS